MINLQSKDLLACGDKINVDTKFMSAESPRYSLISVKKQLV